MANMENGSGSGLNIDKMISFCKKNVKYISGGVLLVALVIVLAVMGVNNSGGKDKPEQKVATEEEEQTPNEVETNDADNQDDTQDANTDKEEHPEIKQLVSTYYNSYATGDLEHLSSVAKKLSDMEKDYIRMMNEHVESYGDISCTVEEGQEGAYIVAAVYQMKFTGADETLPGMNVFYVQTDKNGDLFINNLYSSFNRELKEQKTKKKIIKQIEEFEKSEAVLKLQNEVQTEYDQKVAANEDLQKKLNEMVDAIANWKETYTPPEDTESEEPEQPQEPETTDEGNTDDGADDGNTDDNSEEGNTDEGTEEGNTDDGSTDDGADDGGNGSGLNYVPDGTVLTANDGYNVRKSMDENSELVGTTAVGDSIKVILSYAEGWTKVEWNGTTGYIRTDLLLSN